MSSARTAPRRQRPGGARRLIAALDAGDREARVLEVVAVRPADDLDARWLVGGDARVTRRLTRALRDVAEFNDATWYRLDRLLYAVLAPARFVPGTAAMAARMAVASASESLASRVFHGSVALPDEETGTNALELALARLQDRGRWSSRSTERQVRDVLLRLLAERRTTASPHVAEFAVRVGRKLGLALGELDVLVRAAEMQDLGKVLIPDAILTKRSPLTPEEWAIVRRHPIVAGEILGAAPATAPVARLVRCSQERFDTTGYPDGLGGDAIPIGARIIAVCIAFDAMTADRPYRAALSVPVAIAELRRCAGQQFDPVAVAAFCALVEDPVAPPVGTAAAAALAA